jgi:hypothetical protein
MSPQIPLRKIGNTSVPAIGFGAMGIGGRAYGTAGSNEERFEVRNDHLVITNVLLTSVIFMTLHRSWTLRMLKALHTGTHPICMVIQRRCWANGAFRLCAVTASQS